MNDELKMQQIPPINLYYMLTYALGYPREIEKVDLNKNHFEDLPNLIAKVMIHKFSAQIIRGLSGSFIEDMRENDDINTKIVDFETIQKINDINPKLFYMNDFLDQNNIHTQIIKRTINLILEYKDLKKDYEWELVKIYDYMREVSYINVDETTFKGLITHKNNKSYEFVLKLCEFIWSEVSDYNKCEIKNHFLNLYNKPDKVELLGKKFIKEFYRREGDTKTESHIGIDGIDFTKDWEDICSKLRVKME